MHDNVSSGSPSGRNDGKSCHPGSATGNLYCNNVLPGTATGNIFFSYQRPIVPFRNRNIDNFSYMATCHEDQEQGNICNIAMCHQDLEHGNISNMATCHQDPEPELDYRLELDVL